MKYRNKRDERGMAHVALVVVALVVLIAIGFTGWKVMSDKHNKNATTVSSSSGTSKSAGVASTASVYGTCLAQFHDSNLCHFAAAEASQPITKTAYQATLTSTQSGTAGTLVFQQDGKGNTSLTTSGGDAGQQLDSIQYAGVLYVKNGSVWIKYPSSSSAPQTSNPSSDLSFMSSLTSEHFTKVGTAACGSLTCLKYQFTDSTTPGATNYVWFDTQHYLLREFSSTSASSGSADMKLSYQPVTISVPSPVEDLSTTGQ